LKVIKNVSEEGFIIFDDKFYFGDKFCLTEQKQKRLNAKCPLINLQNIMPSTEGPYNFYKLRLLNFPIYSYWTLPLTLIILGRGSSLPVLGKKLVVPA